jgi:hypothetical protein
VAWDSHFTLLHNYTKPVRGVPAGTDSSAPGPLSQGGAGRADPLSCKRYALGDKQGSFEAFAAAVAAKPSAGGYDSVTRDVRAITTPHDVSHGPRGAGPAGAPRDLSVRGDLTTGDSTNNGEDTIGERRRWSRH